LKHLHQVCERLVSVGLRVNSNKSCICQTFVNFLGYELNHKGIKPMQSKVQALQSLPPPQDHKTLQRYLGMTGFYQRCVPHYSDVIAPLRNLMKCGTFHWSAVHDEAFQKVKDEISRATELAYPDSKAVFTITADASSVAIGACLNQVVDGVSSPLAFYSRKLSDTEARYSTFDRELLAAFAAVKR